MIVAENIRNIAIIAHVDHGKTTLVSNMLQQSGDFRNASTIVIDHNAIEQERGITILAKCTAFAHDGIKYNIIDTPGHADFGGEVERVLSMVDGVILLVDASEGPMPQTKFVLSKALQAGLRPIVVVNKVDRPDSRISEVIDEILELFIALNANEEQVDFPLLYASGRNGWATTELDQPSSDLEPLFKVMREYVNAPSVDGDGPFAMLTTILTADPYVGRLLIGKVYSGSVKVGDQVKVLTLQGQQTENTKLTKIFGFHGINRIIIDQAIAGDIIAIAGTKNATVADTICHTSVMKPIDSTPIDPPTMSVTLSVNDSPFAGTEGSKVTSRMILERLEREAETNVAISLNVATKGESFEVGGRGELQLGVLIENMRREGFELSVSRPRVLFREAGGKKLEPFEEVVVDVDDEYSGVVIEKLSQRRGEMVDMRPSGAGKTRLIFHSPSRGLIGYQSEFRNDTRGTGVLNRSFVEYRQVCGEIPGRRNGSLISNAEGETTAYAMYGLEERGLMFVNAKTKVYTGMIIGEHNKDNDLEVNAIKGKQLTNIRAAGNDENIKLTPPKLMTLEEMLSYIQDDELVEVTPQSLRLRKKLLDANLRKRSGK